MSDAHTLSPAHKAFVALLFIWQLVMIVLFNTITEYDETAKDGAVASYAINYAMFQDVHVMIFVGFGYLMTFLKKYGFSSVGLTFLLAAIVIQWHVIVSGFTAAAFHGKWQTIAVSLKTLLVSDFAAACILISFGVVLGKVTPVQLVIMALFEVVFFSVNEHIGLELGVSDIGGSMVVHMFGAYFGLAFSKVLSQKDTEDNGSVYHSDMFAMVGTLFLWVFWPSFNAAVAEGPAQHRALINTVLSLTASCTCTFICSAVLRADRKFNMVDVQNATLAGGVAVGTVADMMLTPGGALAMGAVAGTLSVIGYTRITPFLAGRVGITDTCGVHNLHGMPAVLSGLCSVLLTAVEKNPRGKPGIQIAFLGITLVFATLSGAVTALLCKALPRVLKPFQDEEIWEVPSETGSIPSVRKSTVVEVEEAEGCPPATRVGNFVV